MNRNRTSSPAPSDDLTLYQQLIEAAPASMAILDAQQPNWPIVYVNAAFEALTGFARADVLGQPAETLLAGSTAEAEPIRAGLKAQTACMATLRSTRRDGSSYWVELKVAPRHDEHGTLTHFVAVQNDVTGYQQALEALHLSEERNKATIEIMPDLIFFHAADTTILGYHAPTEMLLAVPPEQFLGKRVADIFPPEQGEMFATAVSNAIVSRQPGRLEYSIETPSGVLDFEARYIPSGVDQIMAIVRDVTALRQSERQSLIIALEKERTRLLTEFIRNASHEFRTPLSVIGSSAYLMARTEDREKRQVRADQIEANVQRTTKLVDMLLKMAMLDATLPPPERVDVAQVLHVLRTEILPDAEARRVQFNVPTALPPISGHVSLLTDAFRQIVENALRYTPPDGTIGVRAFEDGDTVTVEVRDTGSGIAEDALPHIFETFWRQDEAHTTPGLGLGLSIAQKIVAVHGGRIEVESTLGQGSTFRIVLPTDRSGITRGAARSQ